MLDVTQVFERIAVNALSELLDNVDVDHREVVQKYLDESKRAGKPSVSVFNCYNYLNHDKSRGCTHVLYVRLCVLVRDEL